MTVLAYKIDRVLHTPPNDTGVVLELAQKTDTVWCSPACKVERTWNIDVVSRP